MPKLLTIKQVGEEVGACAKTIRLWIEAGRFPAPVYLPSGEKRWHEVEVIRWQMGLQTTPPANPVKRKRAGNQVEPEGTRGKSEKPPKTPV